MPTWATKMNSPILNFTLHQGQVIAGHLQFLSLPVASGHHPGDFWLTLRCAWQSTWRSQGTSPGSGRCWRMMGMTQFWWSATFYTDTIRDNYWVIQYIQLYFIWIYLDAGCIWTVAPVHIKQKVSNAFNVYETAKFSERWSTRSLYQKKSILATATDITWKWASMTPGTFPPLKASRHFGPESWTSSSHVEVGNPHNYNRDSAKDGFAWK